jgi:hypothetical protein
MIEQKTVISVHFVGASEKIFPQARSAPGSGFGTVIPGPDESSVFVLIWILIPIHNDVDFLHTII